MTEDLQELVKQLDDVVRWLKHRHVSRWRMAFAAFVILAVGCAAGLYWQSRTVAQLAATNRALAGQAVQGCRAGNDVRQSLRAVIRGFQAESREPHNQAFVNALHAFHDRDCTRVAVTVK